MANTSDRRQGRRRPASAETSAKTSAKATARSYKNSVPALLSAGEGDAKGFLSFILSALTSVPVGVLVVGEVGSGKSSAINSVFGEDVARVANGSTLGTEEIAGYSLGAITFWDTPGFGAGRRRDEATAAAIAEKLKETAADGAPSIDIVLMVIDGRAKNLSTVCDVLDDIISPALTGGRRLLTVVRGGNAKGVRARVREDTAIDIEPFPCEAAEIFRRIIACNIADKRPAARASLGGN